ncbi:MAG TPA: hypothetical protein VNI84_16825 [Pyrinomonadaceae bacterium]|nr:hypothetical protein [Pyrinomonadaceae bacterium]
MPEEVKKSKILSEPNFGKEITLFPDGNFIKRNRGEKSILIPNSKIALKGESKFKRISDEDSCRYNQHPAATAPDELWSPNEGSERTRNFRCNFRRFVDFETSIDYYQMRPVTIPFKDDDGNCRRYRPLALLTYSTDLTYVSMKPVLVDVWCQDDIRENWNWFYPAWREAHRFAERNGWHFRLIRDYFFDTAIYRNAGFLMGFRNYPVKNPYFSRLTREIRRLKRVSINELLENICDSPEDYAATLPQLWYLLDANFVGFDLTELLTGNTLIWFD